MQRYKDLFEFQVIHGIVQQWQGCELGRCQKMLSFQSVVCAREQYIAFCSIICYSARGWRWLGGDNDVLERTMACFRSKSPLLYETLINTSPEISSCRLSPLPSHTALTIASKHEPHLRAFHICVVMGSNTRSWL